MLIIVIQSFYSLSPGLTFTIFDTISLAIILIIIVSMSKTAPRPIKADSCKSEDASLNSLAIKLESVWLCEKSVVGIAAGPIAFPIINVTSMVSPTALPNPKMEAPNKPDLP